MTRSNRFIEATATCEAFHILSYDWQYTGDLVYALRHDTNATLQRVSLTDGTTYISNVEDPENFASGIVNCGPRCGHLYVAQIGDTTNIHDAWFYVCQSKVQEVNDADREEEKVPNHIAVIASVSLSESGYGDSLGRSYGYYPDK